MTSTHDPGRGPQQAIWLDAWPEKRLIRPHGSTRHVDFRIQVRQASQPSVADRQPLSLALVLDRSGSMMGDPLETAKRSALAVLDRLGEHDNVAVVIFDNYIDLIQPSAPVTDSLRSRLRSMFAEVQARGSTALHEGWLTGCQAIAGERADRARGSLSRCFLLTDGLANVGLTDPELIASEAAGIWENARVGTSTFGIGPSYDEFLLGPLAVAGGGQFHHLRSASEIVTTFAGELGDLLAVAAGGVRLEIDVPPGARAEVVSQYWVSTPTWHDGHTHLSITIGDLIAGEERHVVVGFRFPPREGQSSQTLRARLCWGVGAENLSSDWVELDFSYAGNAACTAEPRDPEVMRWVSQHQADRAMREATVKSRQGDVVSAQRILQGVREKIRPYAAHDADIGAVASEVDALGRDIASAPQPSMVAKEVVSRGQRRSRGQRDHRH